MSGSNSLNLRLLAAIVRPRREAYTSYRRTASAIRNFSATSQRDGISFGAENDAILFKSRSPTTKQGVKLSNNESDSATFSPSRIPRKRDVSERSGTPPQAKKWSQPSKMPHAKDDFEIDNFTDRSRIASGTVSSNIYVDNTPRVGKRSESETDSSAAIKRTIKKIAPAQENLLDELLSMDKPLQNTPETTIEPEKAKSKRSARISEIKRARAADKDAILRKGRPLLRKLESGSEEGHVRPQDRQRLQEAGMAVNKENLNMIKRGQPWQVQLAAVKKKLGGEAWSPRKKVSPDTVRGMKELNAQDPRKWNTPALSKEFKLDPEAVRRILKSSWKPDEETMQQRREAWARRHDRIWDGLHEMGLRGPRKREAKVEEPDAFEKEMARREILKLQ